MEKNMEVVLLYDIYGKLLTTRQREIFEEYYSYNLSLREIAQNMKISYQAVRDSIKTSIKVLENFEEKIGMKKLLSNVNKVYELCINSENLEEKHDEIISLFNFKSEDDN